MKKAQINISVETLIKDYSEMNSAYKVAAKYGFSATAVKRVLKENNVLNTMKTAAQKRITTNQGKYTRTDKHRQILSDLAKLKTGELNPFFGKTHSEENKKTHSEYMKTKLGNLNPNYRHGKNKRRPRDYKHAEFKPVKNFVFNRDQYTCFHCKVSGGQLHAHHLIPFWVRPEAFLDKDNLLTFCSKCHLKFAHNGDFAKFNSELVSDSLLNKYSLNRERLNELAGCYNQPDAIVRTA